MRTPASSDDDWDDLARELGVDKSAPVPEPHVADMVERQLEAEALEPHHGIDERVELEAIVEGEAEAVVDEELSADEATPGDAAEPMAEGGQTGRKRRRRRRRRKGGGEAELPAEAEGAETENAVSQVEPSRAPRKVGSELTAVVPRDRNDDDSEADDADTTDDVLRDLIATWNVPSWDEIVTGLYRPN